MAIKLREYSAVRQEVKHLRALYGDEEPAQKGD